MIKGNKYGSIALRSDYNNCNHPHKLTTNML